MISELFRNPPSLLSMAHLLASLLELVLLYLLPFPFTPTWSHLDTPLQIQSMPFIIFNLLPNYFRSVLEIIYFLPFLDFIFISAIIYLFLQLNFVFAFFSISFASFKNFFFVLNVLNRTPTLFRLYLRL